MFRILVSTSKVRDDSISIPNDELLHFALQAHT